jgi:hypothetical protein
MWRIEPSTQFEKDLKWYEKKHPRELAAVLDNLHRYFEQIKAARHPRAVQAGYMHHEPHGVVAIDQKGSGKDLRQTRLYTFAEADARLLHLITLGGKKEQSADIKFSSDFVKSLPAT